MSIQNSYCCNDSNNSNETDNTLTITDRLFLPEGSAALPCLTFTSDQNTGVYHPAADSIALVTNGVARATISNTGVAMTAATVSTTLSVTGNVEAKGTLTVTGNTEFKSTVIGDTANFGGTVSTGSLTSSSLGTNAITCTSVSNADGSSSSPAFKFGNDTTTGIYRVNGGQIGFTSTGANAMIIGSTSTIYSSDTYVNGRFNIRPSGSGSSNFRFVNNVDSNRWLIQTVDAESSGSAGSNLVIYGQHDDNSVYEYMRIRRSDGLITGNFSLTTPYSAGTYTPTFYALDNFASAVAWTHTYHKIGTIVTVHGTAEVTMSVVGRSCNFYISLPVDTTFTLNTQLTGTGVARELTNPVNPRVYNQSTVDMAAYTGGTANRAYISVYQLTSATTVNNVLVEYSFSYPVLP